MNVLKLELKRAFFNRRLAIALLCLLAIVAAHIATSVIPASLDQSMYIELTGYPLSVFNRWIGGWPGTVYPALYFFLVPLMVCVPFSDSLYEDAVSGWREQIASRSPALVYLASKYAATFLAGALVASIPLIVDFFLTAMFLPFVEPNAASGLFPIFPYSMWGDVYYSNIFLYNAWFLLLIAATSGLLACIPLSLSRILGNRLVVLCSSLFICTILTYIFGTGSTVWLSPVSFMRPDQPQWDLRFENVLIFLLSLLLLEAASLIWNWRADGSR